MADDFTENLPVAEPRDDDLGTLVADLRQATSSASQVQSPSTIPPSRGPFSNLVDDLRLATSAANNFTEQRYQGMQDLQDWRERVADSEESWQSRVARRYTPFFSGLLNFKNRTLYGRALQRMQAGRPEEGDAELIATQERLAQIDENRSDIQKLRDTLAGAGVVVGEAMLGAGGVRLIGRAAGLTPAAGQAAGFGARAFGLAGAETTAGAGASLFSRAGLAAAAQATPDIVARAAVSLPIMPTLWMENWATRNIRAQRDPLDLRGLAEAYSMGVLQNSVLGSLGRFGNSIPGNTLGAMAERAAVRIVTGGIEQQAIDAVQGVLTSYSSTPTGYGLVHEFLRKDGHPLQHALTQALMFAAFSGLHEMQSGRVMESFLNLTRSMSSKGMSSKKAGELAGALEDRFNPSKEPGLTRSEGQKRVKEFPEGPQREVAQRLADLLPEEAAPGPNEPAKLTGIAEGPLEGPPRPPTTEGGQIPSEAAPEQAGTKPGSMPPTLEAMNKTLPNGRDANRGADGIERSGVVGGRRMYLLHDPAENSVRVDFERASGVGGIAKEVEAGSKALFDKLKELATNLKGTGATIKYLAIDAGRGEKGAEPKIGVRSYRTSRADIYARMLGQKGYDVTGPDKAGVYTATPRTELPATVASRPTTARERATNLEQAHLDALRGLRDAQQAEREAKDVVAKGLPRQAELRAARAARLQAAKDIKKVARELDRARVEANAEEAKAKVAVQEPPPAKESLLERMRRKGTTVEASPIAPPGTGQRMADPKMLEDAGFKATDIASMAARWGATPDITQGGLAKVEAWIAANVSQRQLDAGMVAWRKTFGILRRGGEQLSAARKAGIVDVDRPGAAKTVEAELAELDAARAENASEFHEWRAAKVRKQYEQVVKDPTVEGTQRLVRLLAGLEKTATEGKIDVHELIAKELPGLAEHLGRENLKEIIQNAREAQDDATRVSKRLAISEKAFRRILNDRLQEDAENLSTPPPGQGVPGPEAAQGPAGAAAPAPARGNAPSGGVLRPSLLAILKKGFGKFGGLSKSSAKEHGLDVDEMEENVSTIFKDTKGRNGNLDWTEAAIHLINEGHVAWNKSDAHLADKLRDAILADTKTMIGNFDKVLAKEQAEFYREAERAKAYAETIGAVPEDVERATRQGRASGEAEGRQTSPDKIHESLEAGPTSQAAQAAQGAEAAAGGGAGDELGARPDVVGDFAFGANEPGARPTEPGGGRPGQPGGEPGFGRPITAAERRSGSIAGGQENAPSGGPPLREFALANAKVDQERAVAGLPPLMSEARRANTEVWDAAMARLERDPETAAKLVQELAQKRRETSIEENALLLHRRIVLDNEHRRTMLEYVAASREKADAVTLDALEKREQELFTQIDQLDRVTRFAGTDWGRAGQFRRQLAREDFSLSSMLLSAQTAKGRPLTTQERSELAGQQAKIAALQAKLDQAEAALASEGEGIASEGFGKFIKARAEAREAQSDFRRGLAKDRLEKRSVWEKMSDFLVDLRRMFVISSPKTMAKIVAASLERITIAPMEQVAGAVISRIPGISKIAEVAPREGRGLSINAEKKAFASAFTEGLADAWQSTPWKKGMSELDILFSTHSNVPRSWLHWVGELHGAAKAPAVRAEFTRSFLERLDHASARGQDVTSPEALMKFGFEAYQDSQAAKFQQDNRVVDAWRRAISTLKAPDASWGAKTLGRGMELALPVVRIPTNLVAEAFQYAFGSVTGSVRAAQALSVGIKNLEPAQADSIMRSLKKGSLGLAALAIGYFNPTMFGGFYSGKRKDKEDVVGGMKTPLGTIPAWALHNPLLEIFQMGSTMRRAADAVHRGNEGGLAAGVFEGMVGLAEEVPFVRETTEIARAVRPRERGQFFGELAKSLAVPQLIQWLAGEMDTDQFGKVPRKAKGVLEQIESGIPGLRQRLPIKMK